MRNMHVEWYQKNAEQVLSEQSSDPENGLGAVNAQHRLERFGRNRLPDIKQSGGIPWVRAAIDPLWILLTVSAVIAFILKMPWTGVLFLLAAAARFGCSCLQMRKMLHTRGVTDFMRGLRARTLRDGEFRLLDAAALVPGDIVALEAGDTVPADVYLLESASLRLDQSALTGDATPAEKDASAACDDDLPFAIRPNVAYMGASVLYGRGRGVVVATGDETELGRAARELGDGPDSTAGWLRLVGWPLSIFCVLLWIVFAVVTAARGSGNGAAELLLAAAAVLPACLTPAVTLILSRGTAVLKKKGMLLRDMAAIEALASADVLAVTRPASRKPEQMLASMLWSGGRVTLVEGTGYMPVGAFRNVEGNAVEPAEHDDLMMALTAAALCNDSTVTEVTAGNWQAQGDPAECALTVLAEKAGVTRTAMEEHMPRIGVLPYDAERKMMTTVHEYRHSVMVYTKGDAAEVLSRCTMMVRGSEIVDLDESLRTQVSDISSLMAEEGMLVLALAYRELRSIPEVSAPEDLEHDLVLSALVGITEPAQSESQESLAACRKAGIRPLLVTEDFPEQAASLARELGLPDDPDRILTGSAISDMDDKSLAKATENACVYAEMLPEHKVRLIRALHAAGHVTAVRGDSIRDLGMLREADAAVTGTRSGTAFAQNAAALRLEKDGTASLLHAADVCRGFMDVLTRILRFFAPFCAGAGLAVLFFLLGGKDTALKPAVLLLTQVFMLIPAFVLITEPVSKRGRRWTKPSAAIASPAFFVQLAVQALCTGLLAYAIGSRALHTDPASASSAVAAFLLFSALGCGFSCRSSSVPMWNGKPGRYGVACGAVLVLFIIAAAVAPLRTLLGLSPMSAGSWILALLYALLTMAVAEACKLAVYPLLVQRFPGRRPSAFADLTLPQAGKDRDADAFDPFDEDEPVSENGQPDKKKSASRGFRFSTRKRESSADVYSPDEDTADADTSTMPIFDEPESEAPDIPESAAGTHGAGDAEELSGGTRKFTAAELPEDVNDDTAPLEFEETGTVRFDNADDGETGDIPEVEEEDAYMLPENAELPSDENGEDIVGEPDEDTAGISPAEELSAEESATAVFTPVSDK